MTVYFLIPLAELTHEMVNKSTSTCSTNIPTKEIGGASFYLLEAEKDIVTSTNVFDNYKPYTSKEIDSATPTSIVSKIRMTGIMSDTVAVSTNKTTTYSVPSDFMLTGVVFKAPVYTFGDKIDLIVTLSDDTPVGQYVYDWFIDDTPYTLDIPKSLVSSGLKIKLTYKNCSAVTVAQWFLNAKFWSP